jgi:hypothetical protein
MRQRLLIATIGWAASCLAQAAETTANAIEIDHTTFHCIRKMTPVRHFYVDNLRGDIDASLNSPARPRLRPPP